MVMPDPWHLGNEHTLMENDCCYMFTPLRGKEGQEQLDELKHTVWMKRHGYTNSGCSLPRDWDLLLSAQRDAIMSEPRIFKKGLIMDALRVEGTWQDLQKDNMVYKIVHLGDWHIAPDEEEEPIIHLTPTPV
jgi:hypothetical protein